MKVTLTVGPCAVCGKEPAKGDDFTMILYAGAAWKDAVTLDDGSQTVPVTDGAELYRCKSFCSEHVLAEENATLVSEPLRCGLVGVSRDERLPSGHMSRPRTDGVGGSPTSVIRKEPTTKPI